MIRKDLVQWQWDGYRDNHQNPRNVLIHRLTVPLFWIALGLSVLAVVMLSTDLAMTAIPFFVVPLVAQGIGHKLETKKPEPFLGPMDFVSRFLVEQLLTFPRWSISSFKSR